MPEEDKVVAIVAVRPTCQFQCSVKAEFDFKTVHGPWAYGCELHWKIYRVFVELGTGKGQRLIVRDCE